MAPLRGFDQTFLGLDFGLRSTVRGRNRRLLGSRRGSPGGSGRGSRRGSLLRLAGLLAKRNAESEQALVLEAQLAPELRSHPAAKVVTLLLRRASQPGALPQAASP